MNIGDEFSHLPPIRAIKPPMCRVFLCLCEILLLWLLTAYNLGCILLPKPPTQPAGRTGYFSSVFENPGGDLLENIMSTRPFMDTLRHIEGGVLLEELAEAQRELIQAIGHTNKKGELTVKFTYTPEGHGQVSIEADIELKAPQLARGRSIFFVTPEANLERNDPRQTELELRTVSDEPIAEFRKVS